MVAVLRPEQVEAIASIVEQLEGKGLTEESRRLRDLLAEFESGPQEVSASTAARILEVTPQTVRNWVRGGVLPGRRDQTGHFYVQATALTHALEMHAAFSTAPRVEITGAEIDAEIEAVRAERRERTAARR